MFTNRISNRLSSLEQNTKEPMAAIHLVQSSRVARRFANMLLIGLLIAILAMLFLPWQQTSRGTGQVVAYAPQERQQLVESPIKGIVSRIGDGLVEGSWVNEGDFILEIEPYAPNLKAQLEGQLGDLKTKLETARVKSEVYGENIIAFTEAKTAAVQTADHMIASAKAKLESKERKVSGHQAKRLQADLNHQRQKNLHEKGWKPEKEVEKLKKELDVADADLMAVHKDVISLQKELEAKKSEREEKLRIAQTKIDYARAMQQDALGNMATVQKEMRDVEMKLDQLERQIITAPRNGTIFRIPVYERGQTIKQGDAVLTLIPEASQNAVELHVNGNDMPLVQVGQEVRLQFEGWPAVQFAGWPSVAVGTFSGTVATVDATNNNKSEFRILVLPNEEEQGWPSDRYLRQGVRANGWVMLSQVSLGYEIWRQLNGFPVILSKEEPTNKSDKAKKPKLPK